MRRPSIESGVERKAPIARSAVRCAGGWQAKVGAKRSSRATAALDSAVMSIRSGTKGSRQPRSVSSSRRPKLSCTTAAARRIASRAPSSGCRSARSLVIAVGRIGSARRTCPRIAGPQRTSRSVRPSAAKGPSAARIRRASHGPSTSIPGSPRISSAAWTTRQGPREAHASSISACLGEERRGSPGSMPTIRARVGAQDPATRLARRSPSDRASNSAYSRNRQSALPHISPAGGGDPTEAHPSGTRKILISPAAFQPPPPLGPEAPSWRSTISQISGSCARQISAARAAGR